MNDKLTWRVWIDFRRSPTFETVVENSTLDAAKLEAMRRAVACGWEESAQRITALPADWKPERAA